MTDIYDLSGRFVASSPDIEEMTYKPLISELEMMVVCQGNLPIAMFCHSKPRNISVSIKSVNESFGETGLMKPDYLRPNFTLPRGIVKNVFA